ncbi:MAG: hypothetical protein IMZ55_09225 [Acidobacteria bacterium]|nr:hypothetical protein [Acidobacteriota bacterium]
MDLAKSYGPLRWEPVTEAEGVVHEIQCPTDVAVYFYRRIHAPRAMELLTWYGSDDGLAVWCNGKPVISNKVDRPPGPNQDKALLPLVQGGTHPGAQGAHGGARRCSRLPAPRSLWRSGSRARCSR